MGIPPTTSIGGLHAQTYSELTLSLAGGFLLHQKDLPQNHFHARY